MKALELTQTAAAAALILILSSQLVGWVTAEGRHYVHVVPDSSGICHSRDSWPCFTFSESLQRAEEVFARDTSVDFSAGEYSISTNTLGPEHGITISRAINLILTGPDSPSDQVHINCHRRFRFEFVECNNLIIANMIFNMCGYRSNTSSGALIITNTASLTVANVTVQHSHGYGLMAMGLDGNVMISHCKFFNNSRRPHMKVADNASVRMGGNCILQLMSTVTFIRNTPVLIVSESEFTNGITDAVPMDALHYSNVLSGGGGLGVYMKGYILASVTVLINKCKFVNNSADYGGNLLLFVSVYKSKVSISIANSTFQNGTALSAGGGLHVSLDYDSHTFSKQVYITGSQFISNRAKNGGGLSLTPGQDIILSWLFISENHAEEGRGMYISLEINYSPKKPIHIELHLISLKREEGEFQS